MQMRGRVLPGQYAWAKCGRGEPRPYRVYAGAEGATWRETREAGGRDGSEGFVKSVAL
jgi:hypothetical protein